MQSKMKSIITTTVLTLGSLWYSITMAADKPDTLKGVITLGAAGYGIKLEDGKVIRFMGRGGNTVFAACHNGDTCEITGVVYYKTSNPLFITVTRARKLAGKPAQQTTGSAITPTPNTGPTPVTDKTETDSPLLPVQPSAKPAAAVVPVPPPADPATSATPDRSETDSPFLLDESKDNK